MSPKIHNAAAARRRYAPMFAALGDETRLSLVTTLSDGAVHSISELTEGTRLTRQAVTKHLRVLERARLVRSTRAGRENLFELDPQPMREVRSYIEEMSARWDAALLRLKAMVEES